MRMAFAAQAGLQLGLDPLHRFSVAIVTHHLARELAALHTILIFGGEPSSQDGFSAAVSFRPLGYPSPWYSKPLSLFDRLSDAPLLSGLLFETPLYHPRHAIRLAIALRKERVELVHLHNCFQAIPLIRAFNPDIRIVLHMHCEWLRTVQSRFAKAALGEADMVIGCSDHVCEQIRAAHPHIASRVRTVYNGVDERRFTPAQSTEPADGPRRIVFAGRISPEKGLHTLIDALPEVVAAFPDVQLEIIGPNAPQSARFLAALGDPLVDPRRPGFATFLARSYLNELRRRAELLAPGHVTFTTRNISHEELSLRFRQAALVVSPSLAEAFGMPLVEAMASGVPVVATRVGGIPEVVGDRAGLLVRPERPAELASAICRILADPLRARAMGSAGRARVLERFTWTKIASRYLELVAEVTRNSPGPRARSSASRRTAATASAWFVSELFAPPGTRWNSTRFAKALQAFTGSSDGS
jgi:glycosyltransferase involved in cell wall biosynthesis